MDRRTVTRLLGVRRNLIQAVLCPVKGRRDQCAHDECREHGPGRNLTKTSHEVRFESGRSDTAPYDDCPAQFQDVLMPRTKGVAPL